MKRILRWSLALLVLLAALAAGWTWRLLRRGLAQRDGSATIGALAAPVEVRWDAWGVPHLTAGSGTDLAAATGWIHANDRLEQMELGRRAVSGRLAEVIGAPMVEADAYLRRLRLRRAAERIWDDLGGEGRAWLTAYAAGVNAWVDHRAGALPPLFTLLRIDPEPWTPVDSLGFSLLMAEDLSFWQGRPEEQRFRWLAALGRERLADLLGEPELHVPRAIEEAARRSAAAAASARPAAGRESGRSAAAPGSNNWALASSRSALGAPLVANDPHLGLRLPGTWYEVHLRAPDYQAMGMSLPGVPGVIIGTNGAIAWALTNTMLDDHDVFFERLDERGERVARGDRWQPFAREPARIAVKGGESVEIELAETDRGVLLPADAELGLPPRSLTWSATYAAEPPADPLGAFLQLARARRVAEVPAAVGGFVCPAQNLVVADRDGHLLITVLGRVPARRRGDGRLPSPGWDPSYGWERLLPSAANPSVVDPPEGLLITANNDLRGAGHDRSLVAVYDLPVRAARIRELLSARDRWSPAELAEVQADLVSLHALEVVALLAAGAADSEGDLALRAFAGWDGSMAASGPAALFALLERALVARIFGDELDLDSASGQDQRIWLERALRGEMLAVWFDDVSTPAREGRAQIVASALAAAWSEGAGRWGDDVARWSYGEIHSLLLAHPLGELPLLGRLWNLGPVPQGGSETTVAAFGGGWRDGAQPVAYGPSMRSVAMPSDPDQGLAVLPAGQAGHPLDPHYRDQWALYRQGRLRPVAWSEEAIERATVTRLTLVP